MPHTHGVLWVDMDKGMRTHFDNIYHGSFQYGDESYSAVVGFIDQHISCSSDVDEDLKSLVLELQVHHHTKTCKKGSSGRMCRFHYPRYPCDETIIAKPLPESMPEDEAKELLQKHKKVLKGISDVLADDDLDKSMTVSDMCAKAKVSVEDYYAALKVTTKGIIVLHKRRVCDMYINNYNAEWLRAWNANMDLQVTLDLFAIITYITDYYSKDESGLTAIMQEAWKASKAEPMKKRLHGMKNTFLTHRQMGQSEAFYRVLHSLHLNESNITCTFVATGFPQNRSKFLFKVDDKNNPDAMQVEGHEGKYMAKISVQEYYSNRPKEIEELCLGLFVIAYTKGKSEENSEEKPNQLGVIQLTIGTLDLPKTVSISVGDNTSKFRLRKHVSVLRIHKFKEDNDRHQFAYSQLQLYSPWRNEAEELHLESPELCWEKYQSSEVQKVIKTNQGQIFPYQMDIADIERQVESEKFDRPQHICDDLDPQGEQDNEDDVDCIEDIPDEFAFLHPGDHGKQHPKEGSGSAPLVIIEHEKDIRLNVQKQSEDQHLAYRLVVKFCKDLIKWNSNPDNMTSPVPPLLLVHGGAGKPFYNYYKMRLGICNTNNVYLKLLLTNEMFNTKT